MKRHLAVALVPIMIWDASALSALPEKEVRPAEYAVDIDVARPYEAEIQLRTAKPVAQLAAARGSDGSAAQGVRCSDGRPATLIDSVWHPPTACTDIRWKVRLQDIDERGVDASSPRPTFSQKYRYWLLVEQDSLLRASDTGGRVTLRLTDNGHNLASRRLLLPSVGEPPFIGAIAEKVSNPSLQDGIVVTHFGSPPRYEWLDDIDERVLSNWSRWRRDLGYRNAPRRIDWIWVGTSDNADPGFTASAGTEAILAQLKPRPDDSDFEAKARVVHMTTAMHEGFHVISGSHAHRWLAWVNESLANHFAIEASRRLVDESDRVWLDRFFLSPRTGMPLIEAQRRYAAGAVDQGAAFYADGPAFWLEIEDVLTIAPNRSGRLAALLAESNGFRGIDLRARPKIELSDFSSL